MFSVKADFSPVYSSARGFGLNFVRVFQTWKFDTAFQTTDVFKEFYYI